MADITISLYNNTSKDLVVDKVLTPVTSATGTFRTTVDELRPTFLLVGSVAENVNYAYIAAFNRFYYVTDKKKVTKDLTELTLYTDVRKSFSTQLYAARGIVQRNSQNYDMYLNDPKIPVGAHKTVAIRKFPSTPFLNSNPITGGGSYYCSVSMLVFGGGT